MATGAAATHPSGSRFRRAAGGSRSSTRTAPPRSTPFRARPARCSRRWWKRGAGAASAASSRTAPPPPRTTPTFPAATASASPSRSALDRLRERLQHGDPREFLVVRRDHVPRRGLRGRALDHVVHRQLVLRPLLAVAPVLGRDLVALVRR